MRKWCMWGNGWLVFAVLVSLGMGAALGQSQAPAAAEPAEAPTMAAEPVQAGPDVAALTAAAEAAAATLEQRREAYLLAKGRLVDAGINADDATKQAAADAFESLRDQAGVLRAAARTLDEAGADGGPFRRLALEATGGLRVEDVNLTDAVGLAQMWLERGFEYLVNEGPNLLFQAVLIALVWAVFSLLSKFIGRAVRRALASPKIRASSLLKDFLAGLVQKAVLLVGILVILNQVGLQVGPLLAGLGVAGFIAGFALQDVLGNFAAGVMILFYRPFDVGDFVRAGGEMGTVREMSLVNTVLTTPDNQRLIVPNKKIWGETIQNVTANPTRRVDLVFGIDYGDDMAKAEAILQRVVAAHPLVLKEPEAVIRVHKLGESSVDFVVRPWVKSADYWAVYWDLTRAVKAAFDQEGITIPFPQRTVHWSAAPGQGVAG